MTKRVPTRPLAFASRLVLPLVAVAVLATACGGGSNKASTASQSSTTTIAPGGSSAARADFAKYTSCLESHGVPASEAAQGFGGRRGAPGSSTSSSTATPPTTTAAFAAARTACRSDLPTGGFGGFGRGGGFTNTAAGKLYEQCLQAHGVTLPSTPPTTAAGSTASSVPGTRPAGGFADNPAYQAARTACAALLPAGSGSATTTTAP